MRNLFLILFAYLMFGFQAGIGGTLGTGSGGGGEPNFILLVVVFLALNVSRETVLTGSLVIGLLHDLFSGTPPGLHALAYGLVALVVSNLSRELKTDHPLAHAFVAFLGQLILASLLLLHSAFPRHLLGLSPDPNPTYSSFASLVASCIWTAIVAPFILYLATKLKLYFGMARRDRRANGLRAY